MMADGGLDIEGLKRDIVRVAQAEQSAYQRIEAAEAEAARWRARARLAVEHGDEALARQALERAARFADQAAAARGDFTEIAGQVADMKRQLRDAQGRASLSKETLAAQAWLAAQRDPVAERIESLEREVAGQRLDDQLAALKADMAAREDEVSGGYAAPGAGIVLIHVPPAESGSTPSGDVTGSPPVDTGGPIGTVERNAAPGQSGESRGGGPAPERGPGGSSKER